MESRQHSLLPNAYNVIANKSEQGAISVVWIWLDKELWPGWIGVYYCIVL